VIVEAHGRELEVLCQGTGRPLVFHFGTPNAPDEFPLLAEAAAERGLQLIAHARPGYAGSTPQEGRTVADVAGDVAAILDHLGIDRFLTVGWSGGGPHALACAALLPDRCDGAAVIAGVAPYGAEGLDFLAGMGPENVEEFGLAATSRTGLEEFLEAELDGHRDVTGERLADALGALVSDVDRAALTGEFADALARLMRRGVSAGIAGWRDDDLAFAKPWGFDVAAIETPVSIWHGAQDLMVPFAHGEWLAAHVPAAGAHLYEDEGHISLVRQLPRIFEELLSRAGG
jgi:pimeloyl-ACP methyl ester carboxylesterase